jgi:predicted 3-demethylubiquinone-9 3-methyltransferase (glyoxalase superfamily)
LCKFPKLWEAQAFAAPVQPDRLSAAAGIERPSGDTAARDPSRSQAMQKITPFLWFDTEAEEAARFYVSLFRNSKIGQIARYGDAGPGPKGQVMTISFELDGLHFTALNGGPIYKFTEAVSLQVDCEDQTEIDRLWDGLTADGGQPGPCGWLKDRFGLSWQIVPGAMGRLIGGDDPAKSSRAMQAMMQMTKLDIAALEKAREG